MVALIGEHHGQSEKAKELGLKIVAHIRQRCDEIKKERSMNFSCYATPAEGLSDKFTVLDEKFGFNGESVYGKVKDYVAKF